MLNNKIIKTINNKKISLKAKTKSTQSKLAFTLAEVVIASLISSIILSLIFIFLWDISNWIVDTKNETILMSRLYEFSNKINNYRNIYTTWSILINNTSTWSDVFLMRDATWTNGVLLWTVKLENKKLDTDNTIYADKWVWFRKLSSSELALVDSDVNNVYDFIFQDDQIYTDFKAQDMILESYNSWAIYDLSLVVDMNFQNSLVWQFWQDLPRDNLKKFNLDF